VLIRQRRLDDQLDRLTGQRVKITVDRPDQYQMDGDTVGECTSLLAEVQPGALLLRVPRLRREITAGPSAVTGDPSTNGASPPGTAPLAEAAPAEAVPTSGVPR